MKRAGACLIHVPHSVHQVFAEPLSPVSSLAMLTSSSYTIPSHSNVHQRSKDYSNSCYRLSRLVL